MPRSTRLSRLRAPNDSANETGSVGRAGASRFLANAIAVARRFVGDGDLGLRDLGRLVRASGCRSRGICGLVARGCHRRICGLRWIVRLRSASARLACVRRVGAVLSGARLGVVRWARLERGAAWALVPEAVSLWLRAWRRASMDICFWKCWANLKRLAACTARLTSLRLWEHGPRLPRLLRVFLLGSIGRHRPGAIGRMKL